MRTPGAWPSTDLVAHRAAATPDRTAVVDTSGLDPAAANAARFEAEPDDPSSPDDVTSPPADDPASAGADDAGGTRDATTVTYRELDAAVDRRAAALASLAGTDDAAPTVGVLLDPRLAYVELLFATVRLGGTFVPLNHEAPPDQLADQLARAGVDCLVCDLGTETLAMAVLEAADTATMPVASVDQFTREDLSALGSGGTAADRTNGSGDDRTNGSGEDRTNEPDADATPVGSRESIDPDDDAVIVFTSGSTGEAKGVRLTTSNLVASASASAFRLGVDPADRWLVCLPTYHVGGLAPIVRSVLYGTTVVLQPSFDEEETPGVVERCDVTGVSLVPTMLRRLLDAGWHPPEHLRFVLLGGGAASTDLLDQATSVGVPVCPTYGSTETASQVATARTDEAIAHEGTVGQPLVTTAVTIVGEDGEPCDPGERGEIVVDGPTVMAGYLDDARTAEVTGEFGFHTGDCGYRDADGRLWVLGRMDAQIITGGENVAPTRVADVIREHPDVRDVAVVGIDDPEWGERVAALVVPREAASLSAYDVRGYCGKRLADYEVPKTVGFASSVPRTASGTVDRERVRDHLQDGPTT